MDNLSTVYQRLSNNPDDTLSNIRLYRSEVHYAKAAVHAATGVDLTLEEMDTYLTEEGMQPASPEADHSVDEIHKKDPSTLYL